MSSLRKSTLLVGLCAAVLAYLAGDLWIIHGPLSRRIGNPEALAAAKAKRVVARVSNQKITRSQLDRAVSERLWLTGQSVDALTPENRKLARYAALDELIDHELLRINAQTHAHELRVTDAEIDERLQRFCQRFESKDAMLTAMKSQGITRESALRDRLAAHIQLENDVESRIGPLAQVSDAEARAWFDQNQRELAIPERVEVRHVFLPTLDHPSAEAKAKLDTALASLNAGRKDFATLAKELSEDPATQNNGGSLGWMTRLRLPADFSGPVFALPLHHPSLIQTHLGWHLVEVTARKPAEPRTFEQAKPEVLAALKTIKRRQAVSDCRAALRKSEAAKIEVFTDKMAE